MNKEERSGELFMLAFAFSEGWFPILTIITLQFISPIFVYSFTLIFATLSFVSLLVIQNKTRELIYWPAYKDLLLVSLFMTATFACIYIGLVYTSAGNMAVLIFLQVFFSFVYFNILGKESFSKTHLIGAILMVSGALIILFPEQFIFNIGDLLILIAAAIAPIANFYQKRARKKVSSETILAFRSLAALPVLLLMAFLIEPLPSSSDLLSALPYIAASGVLLMGLSKIFWVESIHRISITKASAMAALIPVFTLLFAYLILNETPGYHQLTGIVPVLLGGYLITRRKKHVIEHTRS
ncbi:MAG: DMT family transporter [Gammaproteobacteria bacterium]|nr:DMT family transporter [Gammaproteobacteria bacterium]